MKREFKYYPVDFKQLQVKVLHMDLDFDIFNAYTKVKSDLKLSERVYKCECGLEIDRDMNAAFNLANYGKLVA